MGEGSDEWITGYVGAAVGAAAPAAARRAWDALAVRKRWSGGWGYMPSYPPDADSTACALRLAETLSDGGGLRAVRARFFLSRHQHAGGGISTYRWPRHMVWRTRLRETFEGWCSPHVCVSANVAQLHRFRGRSRCLSFLREAQGDDGAWRAYWWFDEAEYATALAVEALAESGNPADAATVRRAAAWVRRSSASDGVVRSRAAPEGSAFATALRLRILLAAPERESRDLARAMLGWLVGAQHPDGRWASSAWLRFPPTEVIDPGTIPEWHLGQMLRAGVMQDERALFTTATVLPAIARAAQWVA